MALSTQIDGYAARPPSWGAEEVWPDLDLDLYHTKSIAFSAVGHVQAGGCMVCRKLLRLARINFFGGEACGHIRPSEYWFLQLNLQNRCLSSKHMWRWAVSFQQAYLPLEVKVITLFVVNYISLVVIGFAVVFSSDGCIAVKTRLHETLILHFQPVLQLKEALGVGECFLL